MNNLTNYGQHFLVDRQIIREFIKACDLEPKDTVLEIGPGQGAITVGLCQHAREVMAIEIDNNLKPKLTKLEQKFPNLKVVYGNALKIQDYHYDLVCGALSFAIFEPLMIKLFKKTQPKRLVFLVSHKVKVDFAKEQGLLFYLLNSFYQVKFGQKILPKSFLPKPRTAGVIISLLPQLPKLPRFVAWRERFLTDKTIWQKTVSELQEIDS